MINPDLDGDKKIKSGKVEVAAKNSDRKDAVKFFSKPDPEHRRLRERELREVREGERDRQQSGEEEKDKDNKRDEQKK